MISMFAGLLANHDRAHILAFLTEAMWGLTLVHVMVRHGRRTFPGAQNLAFYGNFCDGFIWFHFVTPYSKSRGEY